MIRDRNVDALNRRHFVGGADGGAFGAGAIVAADIDDQRVVELAHVFDGLDDPADFMVGVGQVGGVDVRLADEQFLLVGVQRVPFLEKVLGPRRQLGVVRNDAELFLVGEDLLAERVPALVEQVQVADFLDPLRRGVVRRVRAAGHVVAEERLVGGEVVELIQPVDGFVGHGGGEVPAGLADVRINRGGVAEQIGLPLAGIAADEAVEVLEAHADRPLVEGPGLAVENSGVLWFLPNHEVP